MSSESPCTQPPDPFQSGLSQWPRDAFPRSPPSCSRLWICTGGGGGRGCNSWTPPREPVSSHPSRGRSSQAEEGLKPLLRAHGRPPPSQNSEHHSFLPHSLPVSRLGTQGSLSLKKWPRQAGPSSNSAEEKGGPLGASGTQPLSWAVNAWESPAHYQIQKKGVRGPCADHGTVHPGGAVTCALEQGTPGLATHEPPSCLPFWLSVALFCLCIFVSFSHCVDPLSLKG